MTCFGCSAIAPIAPWRISGGNLPLIRIEGKYRRLVSKMADFEVALTTDAGGDSFCISLWDLATGMQLKVYKGGCCPSRCVSLLGKDYIMASQVNKPIIHVWNTAQVNKY